MAPPKISVTRIGTRGSPLALWQAREVVWLLKKAEPSLKIEEIIIKTSGDKFGVRGSGYGVRGSGYGVRGSGFGVRGSGYGVRYPIPDTRYPILDARYPIPKYSGKGLFVKEIEEALQSGKIDIAVHSLKDVPAVLPCDLQLTAFLKRADPYDLFVSAKYKNLETMPQGATLGTSSPRRAAQALAVRPDLKIVPLRGNVETRIRKTEEGECDATILATAGINRLGLSVRLKHLSTYALKHFIPAIGQGIVCVESCKQDSELNKFLRKALNHAATEQVSIAERAFLKAIGGDCHTPIAAHAVIKNERIELAGFVASPNGKKILIQRSKGRDPLLVGSELGMKFVSAGARKMMQLKGGSKGYVLFTGLAGTLAGMKEEYAGKGYYVIELPLIKICKPSDNYRALKRALKRIDEFDWVAFTSRNAVDSFFALLKTYNLQLKARIAAVGPATAAALAGFGFKADIVAKKAGAKGLIKEFKKVNIAGKRILFPRAKEGLDMLAEGLAELDAVIDVVEAYRTVANKIDIKGWKRFLSRYKPKKIIFSSPSAIKIFRSNFRAFLR